MEHCKRCTQSTFFDEPLPRWENLPGNAQQIILQTLAQVLMHAVAPEHESISLQTPKHGNTDERQTQA